MKFLSVIFFALFVSVCAFAQIEPIPDVDPLQKLLELILNFKTMTPLAIGMALVVVGTQAVKKFLPNWPYSRITVLALSLGYSIVHAISQGTPLLNAAIMVLITGGGAIALYEALKGLGILGASKK